MRCHAMRCRAMPCHESTLLSILHRGSWGRRVGMYVYTVHTLLYRYRTCHTHRYWLYVIMPSRFYRRSSISLTNCFLRGGGVSCSPCHYILYCLAQSLTIGVVSRGNSSVTYSTWVNEYTTLYKPILLPPPVLSAVAVACAERI